MSIVFYGFLGNDTQDLEYKFVLEFSRLGFEVAIHPKMRLLEPNGGHFYLALIKTPPDIKRLLPDIPLLTEFEYSASKRTSTFEQEEGWPPRRVRRYTYEICTRTASGRATASYFAQALTVAVLSKITNGQFFADGNREAVSGQAGLDSILTELGGQARSAFDVGANPFNDWPPLDPIVPFTRSAPIAAPDANGVLTQSPPKKKFKITLMGVIYTAIFLYFLTVTLLYS
ncbi:hypothetical protein INP81_13215 [Comamonas thiooxydans]|nr:MULTISPECIES: hypothetical protein [Comamonas]QOQ80364.1 hypothetical protein INP81_13215 [Comamonas thiooxydans]